MTARLPTAILLTALLATPVLAETPALEELPDVETAQLEERVVAALAAARARIEELESDSERADGELAEAYGEFGRVHHAHDLLLPARIGYRNASSLAPDSAEWPYLLGRVELELGDVPAADQAFGRARELEPDNVSILVGCARLRRLEGRTEEAIELARRALEIDAGSAAARLELAEASLDAGEFAVARDSYEWLLERQPSASKLVTALASAYRGLGETARAESMLQRRGEIPVAVRDPWLEQVARRRTGAQADLERGSAAFGRGDWAAAAEAFRSAAASDPSSAGAFLNLGAALIRMGEGAEAREALERARELEPRNPTALINLAALTGREGDLEGAVTLYREALGVAPDLPAARIGLAKALLGAGHAEEALGRFRSALELAPGDSSLLGGELLALHELERSDELLERLDADLARNPGDVRLLSITVRLLAASPLEAVRDGHRALAIATRIDRSSRSVGSLELLAMAFAETGDFPRAVAALRTALSAPRLDASTRARFEADLRRYQSRQPRRDPGLN